jgi:CheY-like chemotaxis protein
VSPSLNHTTAPHILVADDNVHIRRLAQKHLEQAGYHVTVAVDGQKALGRIGSLHPDLLVLDGDMPRLEAREAIEAAFGEPLLWQPLEGKRACRVSALIGAGGLRDADRWPRIQEAMVDAMIRFEAALRPYLANLPV